MGYHFGSDFKKLLYTDCAAVKEITSDPEYAKLPTDAQQGMIFYYGRMAGLLRAKSEVKRLRKRLRAHGIDPDHEGCDSIASPDYPQNSDISTLFEIPEIPGLEEIKEIEKTP